MSEEIPYLYETPIPSFFVLSGWFNDPHNIPLLYHCFARCSPHAREIVYDGMKLKLAPFEFICGRMEMSKITGLSQDQVRRRLEWWIQSGFLFKTNNSYSNRFTCYKWRVSHFSKKNQKKIAQVNESSEI